MHSIYLLEALRSFGFLPEGLTDCAFVGFRNVHLLHQFVLWSTWFECSTQNQLKVERKRFTIGFYAFFELGIRWIWTLPLYLVTLYARKLNRCNNSRKRGRDSKWVFFLFSHAERKKLHAEKSNSERFFYCHKFQVTRILCHNVDIIHTQYVVESNETFPFLSFGFWNACETANCQESSRCRRKT